MAETSVLEELRFDVVPIWSEKIERYIREAEDAKNPKSGLIITPSGPVVEDTHTPKVLTPGKDDTDGQDTSALESSQLCPDKGKTPGVPYLKKTLATPHGICRLDAKPDTSKTRFSSITGPMIMYDGESQQMLNELWTLLNNKRGALRREMMALKRRQELSAPRMMNNPIEVDSETDGNSTGKDEEEDLEHSSEMLRLRLKIERERLKRMNRRPGGGIGGAPTGVSSIGGLPFKRARTMAGPPVSNAQALACAPSGIDDQRLKKLLEAIDENLDKACKVTETVAFVWLKGDSYEGHLKFIVGRLKDTLAKIEASGFASPKRSPEGSVLKPTDGKMCPPTPAVSRPQLNRKKSDITMRDECIATVVASSSNPESSIPVTIPATIEVGSTKDEITPEDISTMLTGKVPVRDSFKPPQQRSNVMEPEFIEVEEDDEDDEGIVC